MELPYEVDSRYMLLHALLRSFIGYIKVRSFYILYIVYIYKLREYNTVHTTTYSSLCLLFHTFGIE